MPELKKAYQLMQDSCGINVGDTVRVLRANTRNELGSSATWHSLLEFRNVQNKTGVVLSHQPGFILIDFGPRYWYAPFFVLELVEKKKIIRKEITTKFYDENGNDITDKLSAETKAGL